MSLLALELLLTHVKLQHPLRHDAGPGFPDGEKLARAEDLDEICDATDVDPPPTLLPKPELDALHEPDVAFIEELLLLTLRPSLVAMFQYGSFRENNALLTSFTCKFQAAELEDSDFTIV